MPSGNWGTEDEGGTTWKHSFVVVVEDEAVKEPLGV
jgi:hypothetical protein